MLNQTEIKELIHQQGLLPLYFHEDADVSIEILKALHTDIAGTLNKINPSSESNRFYQR